MQTMIEDLRHAAQVAHIGFASLDADGRFEQANETYLEMLGRYEAELIGESWRATIYPEDHNRAEEAYRCARRDGHGYVEIRGLRGDGTIVYQSLTLTRRGGPDADTFEGFHCIRHDISSYKSDQEALMLAVECAPNGFVMLNSTGHIRMVNAAVEKLFGYSRDELIHQPVETLLPTRFREDHQTYREAFNSNTAMKAMAGRDLKGLRKDGVEIPLQVYLNTIDTPAGTLILTTIIDITERLRYQSQLEQAKQAAESASRAKSDFLARMSHEIRTPMNLIMGMNALLLEGELSAKQREYVEISYRNVKRLLRLINGILDLSKVEAGKFTLEAVPFDLNDVLHECSATISSAVEQKGLTLDLNIDQELYPYWLGDPERLQQVLLNLIGNAVKFTSEGKIQVAVKPVVGQGGANGIQFEITDTGCGITADKTNSIFEAFEQADDSMNRSYEGTGLGLAIARALVQLMSGDLWVMEKEGPGAKFAFTAFFPRASEDSFRSHVSKRRLSKATHQIKPGTRILVAEDNPENVILLQSYLQGLPLVLDLAQNGKLALDKRCANDYDLVLMDIQMPVMDGYTATGEIRAWEKAGGRKPVPIVALTAHAITGASADSMRAGCTGHLTKPIERDDLIAAIARFTTNVSHASATLPPQPGIEALRPEFLANRQRDLVRLRELLQQDDFAAIQVIAHNCKGIGKSYGFPALSVAGAALETAAKSRDPGQIHSMVTSFEQSVATACASAP